MGAWGGYWNVVDGTYQYLLGDSCDEHTAQVYVQRYKEKYPALIFEAVSVDFAHPPWFSEDCRGVASIRQTF